MELKMKVTKFKTTLHLKLDSSNESPFEPLNDELFWNDIYIESSNSWLYLNDTNRNQVCCVNDYGFDLFNELKTGKTVVFHYRENDPEYEFNQS